MRNNRELNKDYENEDLSISIDRNQIKLKNLKKGSLDQNNLSLDKSFRASKFNKFVINNPEWRNDYYKQLHN